MTGTLRSAATVLEVVCIFVILCQACCGPLLICEDAATFQQVSQASAEIEREASLQRQCVGELSHRLPAPLL